MEEFVGPLLSNDERRRFVDSLWELQEEISRESTKPTIDPSKLMRLMALGINHCLVGVGTILMSSPSSGLEVDQGRSSDSVPDLMESAHRESE